MSAPATTAVSSAPPQTAVYPSAARAWWAVAVLFIAYTVSFVDRTILSLLVEPIRHDLHLTDTGVSLLQGLAFAIFYTTMGIPIAIWSDRGSRRLIAATGIFVWSLMTAACGLATSFWRLFAARLGVGVGEAALSPATYSLIADLFPERLRGRALGVFGSGVNVGAGLAFLIGGAVVGMTSKLGAVSTPFGLLHPWQLVFLYVGLPGMIVALLALTIHEPRHGARTAEPAAAPGAFGRFLVSRRAAITAHFLGFSVCGLAFTAVASWAPTFLIRHYGFTAAQAGKSLGLAVLIVGTLGALTGGALSDRWMHLRDGTLRIGLIAIVVQTLAGLLGPLVGVPALSIVCFSLVFFCGGFAYTAGATAMQKVTPPRLRARMSALYLFVVSVIATALGPTSIALLTDHYFKSPAAVGYSMAVVAALIGPLGCLAFGLGLRPFARAVAQTSSETPNSPA
jgi:MFS family permease